MHELEYLMEKAFCDGYEYAQREFAEENQNFFQKFSTNWKKQREKNKADRKSGKWAYERSRSLMSNPYW